MKIALQDTFPHLAITSEKQFIKRATIALASLGHEAASVATSAEIEYFKPDILLITHHATPKLADFPSIGLMWNPLVYIGGSWDGFSPFTAVHEVQNILTYDGYISGAPQISLFLRNLLSGVGKSTPITGFIYPSCHRTELKPSSPSRRSLFYSGANWDEPRWKGIFEILDEEIDLDVYGPEAGWEYLKHSYRGSLPIDGSSVITRVAEAGVAFCVHRPEHRYMGTPSSRLFEAAAAGAVIITDDFSFPREHFKDSVLYIDMEASERKVADGIKHHMDWIRLHPEQADKMAEDSHKIFRDKLCLEHLFRNLEEFADTVKKTARYYPVMLPPVAKEDEYPLVEYVVRVGTQSGSSLQKSIASLRNQTYPDIGIILVLPPDLSGQEGLVERYGGSFAKFKTVSVGGNCGSGLHQLWAGLRAVSAPLFGTLDAGHKLHRNHVATLVEMLGQQKQCSMVYSGCIVVGRTTQYDAGKMSPTDSGNKAEQESRRIHYVELCDSTRLPYFDYFIAPHAWLARREVLGDWVIKDPELQCGENLYVLVQLRRETPFIASWRWSAELHCCPEPEVDEKLASLGWKPEFPAGRPRPTSDSPNLAERIAKLEESLDVLRGLKRSLTPGQIPSLIVGFLSGILAGDLSTLGKKLAEKGSKFQDRRYDRPPKRWFRF